MCAIDPVSSGGPPDRMVGRSDKRFIPAKDGRFEPPVIRACNKVSTHVATSPDTVMILNEAGQLETHGPSRTEIRQDPTPLTPTPNRDPRTSPHLPAVPPPQSPSRKEDVLATEQLVENAWRTRRG